MNDQTAQAAQLPEKRFVPTQPGVYFDIDEDVYHNEIKAVSSSMLKLADQETWAHVWAQYFDPDREVEEKDPAHFSFGKAYHCLLLEPKTFNDRFAVAPDHTLPEHKGYLASAKQLEAALKDLGLPKTGTNLEKAKRLQEAGEERSLWPIVMDDFMNQVNGRTVLTAVQMKQLQKMADRILGEPVFMQGLTGGHAEATFLWQDEETGLMLKVRTDYYVPRVCITDLKSSLTAAPWDFPNKAEKLGYPIQHAMYLDGVKQAANDDLGDHFMFIAQEKKSPFLAAPFQCTPEMAEEGYKTYRRRVCEMANILGSDERMNANNWPGYDASQIWPIDKPSFSMRRKRRLYR